MTPESVGIEASQDGRGTLVLGKHSGKAAYRQRLIELGYADIAADREQLAKLVEGAKAVADQKKTVSDQVRAWTLVRRVMPRARSSARSALELFVGS